MLGETIPSRKSLKKFDFPNFAGPIRIFQAGKSFKNEAEIKSWKTEMKNETLFTQNLVLIAELKNPTVDYDFGGIFFLSLFSILLL